MVGGLPRCLADEECRAAGWLKTIVWLTLGVSIFALEYRSNKRFGGTFASGCRPKRTSFINGLLSTKPTWMKGIAPTFDSSKAHRAIRRGNI